jgi:hypothetical protein
VDRDNPNLRFAARVEDELRRRREQQLGRCTGCGKGITATGDFARAGDGLMHAECLGVPAGLALTA